MFINLKKYVKEILYKRFTIFKCDYEFYDVPFYLCDFEESDS